MYISELNKYSDLTTVPSVHYQSIGGIGALMSSTVKPSSSTTTMKIFRLNSAQLMQRYPNQ